MRFKIGMVLISTLLCLWHSPLYGVESPPSLDGQPRGAKVFCYQATRFGLPIAKATVEVAGDSFAAGKGVVEVLASFHSLPYLKPFFRMKNRFISTMDRETCVPMRYVKEIDQDGLLIQKKQYLHRFLFEPDLQRVVVERGEKDEREVVPLPPHTYDPLSMFARCYLREEIQPDQEMRMSIYDGMKLRQMVFHSKKERVRSKVFGTVQAVRLESSTSFSTFGDREGVIRIWYLAEGERIPLLMELELPVGTVRFELESLQKGG